MVRDGNRLDDAAVVILVVRAVTSNRRLETTP